MKTVTRRLTSLFLTAVMLCSICCEALADSMRLPDALQQIEEEAFYGDVSLDEVVIPYGATSIGDWAFASGGLRKIYIPETVTRIADNAFDAGVTVVSSEHSYAYEYADRNNLTWERNDSFYLNEQLSDFLPVIDCISDADSILPAGTDYTPESTDGVTEDELLELIEDYNAFLLELEESDEAYTSDLGDILNSFDSLADEMLASDIQLSENGRMMELSGIQFSLPDSVLSVFEDDYTIGNTTVLENGDFLIEIVSGGTAYSVLGTETGLSLQDADGNEVLVMSAAFVDLDAMFNTVSAYVSDFQNWVDVGLQGISDRLNIALEKQRAKLDRLEKKQGFITEKSANLLKQENIRRATKISEKNAIRISAQKTVIQNIEKFIGAVTGISAGWDVYQMRKSLDEIIKLQEIEKHGHPTEDDLSNSEKSAYAIEMPDLLLSAKRAYIYDVVSNSLMFVTDLASLISNVALFIPGAQGFFIGGKIGILATKASLAAISTVLFSSGFVSSVAATTFDTRIKKAERILHETVLSGQVYDASTGDAIPGARVMVDDGAYTATTDEDGLYGFTVTPGKHALEVNADKYETEHNTNVQCEENKITICNVPMTPECAIRGIVIDGNGNPLERVRVFVNDISVFTDANGLYSARLPEGRYWVEFMKSGYVCRGWYGYADRDLSSSYLTTLYTESAGYDISEINDQQRTVILFTNPYTHALRCNYTAETARRHTITISCNKLLSEFFSSEQMTSIRAYDRSTGNQIGTFAYYEEDNRLSLSLNLRAGQSITFVLPGTNSEDYSSSLWYIY